MKTMKKQDAKENRVIEKARARARAKDMAMMIARAESYATKIFARVARAMTEAKARARTEAKARAKTRAKAKAKNQLRKVAKAARASARATRRAAAADVMWLRMFEPFYG